MTESSLIRKIKSLFALSEDENNFENERNQALAKAMELLAEHNLDMAIVKSTDLTERPNDEATIFSSRDVWLRRLCYIVGELYFVSAYQDSKYRMHFVGTTDNIQVTVEMVKFLAESIRKESNKRFIYSKERRSFRLGAVRNIIIRIRQMLEDQKKQPEISTGTSLMVIRNSLEKANDAYLDTLGLRTAVSRTCFVEGSAYEQGQQYGSKLHLGKQIGATKRIGG